MSTKLFWNYGHFTAQQTFQVMHLDDTGENITEYFSCTSADLNDVVDYMTRIVASTDVDEIMVRNENYTYLEPWINVLREKLIAKNYSHANDIIYRGI